MAAESRTSGRRRKAQKCGGWEEDAVERSV